MELECYKIKVMHKITKFIFVIHLVFYWTLVLLLITLVKWEVGWMKIQMKSLLYFGLIQIACEFCLEKIGAVYRSVWDNRSWIWTNHFAFSYMLWQSRSSVRRCLSSGRTRYNVIRTHFNTCSIQRMANITRTHFLRQESSQFHGLQCWLFKCQLYLGSLWVFSSFSNSFSESF